MGSLTAARCSNNLKCLDQPWSGDALALPLNQFNCISSLSTKSHNPLAKKCQRLLHSQIFSVQVNFSGQIEGNDWASAGITQWLHALLNAHLDRHWHLTIPIPHKTSIARLPEVWREFGLFPCNLHSEAEILRICDCTVWYSTVLLLPTHCLKA